MAASPEGAMHKETDTQVALESTVFYHITCTCTHISTIWYYGNVHTVLKRCHQHPSLIISATGITALEERRDRGISYSPGPWGHQTRGGWMAMAEGREGSHASHGEWERERRHRGDYRPSERSRSPPAAQQHRRNHFDRSPQRSNELEDTFDGPVLVLPSLRQLTALEDILGSLGPQINSIMGRALNLEQVKKARKIKGKKSSM